MQPKAKRPDDELLAEGGADCNGHVGSADHALRDECSTRGGLSDTSESNPAGGESGGDPRVGDVPRGASGGRRLNGQEESVSSCEGGQEQGWKWWTDLRGGVGRPEGVVSRELRDGRSPAVGLVDNVVLGLTGSSRGEIDVRLEHGAL